MVTWQGLPYEGEQVLDNGGNIAGDLQATESFTLRYVLADEPSDGLHALIDEYWYGELINPLSVEKDGVPPEYGVTCMMQYTICTDLDDPGGTEEWADIEYDTGADVRVYTEPEAAFEAARRQAERSDPSTYTWDGRTRKV